MNRQGREQEGRNNRDSRMRKSIFDPEINNSPSRPQFQKLYSNNRDSQRPSSIDHTIVKQKSCPNWLFVVLGLIALAGLVTLFVLGLLNYSGPHLKTNSVVQNPDIEDGITDSSSAPSSNQNGSNNEDEEGETTVSENQGQEGQKATNQNESEGEEGTAIEGEGQVIVTESEVQSPANGNQEAPAQSEQMGQNTIQDKGGEGHQVQQVHNAITYPSQ